MQVQAVNTQNNQTSFGAIFYPKNIKFNKVQEPIAETIKNALREPLQKFKGETAEGFYKSKGLDFEIAPHSSESVSLYAYKGMKEIGRGVDRGYKYSDKMCIGEYDKNSEFRISDIESGLKEHNGSAIGFIAVALTGIAALILCAIGKSGNSDIKRYETTKPLIENVDSVANKAKSVLPDTTAVNTKILKTIKK